MSGISVPSVSGANSILKALQNTAVTGADSEKSFGNVLDDALEQYKEINDESNSAMLDLLTGSTDDISSVMIASEKSEIALNLTVAIRNKAVDAYKEIMNMQV